jgi:hypothetical protein
MLTIPDMPVLIGYLGRSHAFVIIKERPTRERSGSLAADFPGTDRKG